MTNTNKFVRLGVIGDDYFPNNSIIFCLNTLIHCIKLNTNKNEPIDKPNYIIDALNNFKIFKPSIFITLANGNMIELFRDENNIKKLIPNKNKISKKNEEILKDLLIFLEIFESDLSIINLEIDFDKLKGKKENLLELNDIQELYNLYTAFTNFLKYSKSDDIYKNPEYYLELLGKDNFIFPKGINSYVIEKMNKFDLSKINLVCPKHYSPEEYYTNENNIILVKVGKYFEPLINIHFSKDKKESKNIDFYYPNNNKQIKKLNKIINKNCKNNTLTLTKIVSELGYKNIKYFIRGKYPKIIALVLKDNVFVKITASGIKLEYLPKLYKLNKINQIDIINFDEYNKYPDSKKDNELVKKIKQLNLDKISNDSTEKSIDNLIFDDIMEKDIRMIYTKKYSNNIKEFSNIILGVNRFLIDNKNLEIRENIVKILRNPVFPIYKKKMI